MKDAEAARKPGPTFRVSTNRILTAPVGTSLTTILANGLALCQIGDRLHRPNLSNLADRRVCFATKNMKKRCEATDRHARREEIGNTENWG